MIWTASKITTPGSSHLRDPFNYLPGRLTKFYVLFVRDLLNSVLTNSISSDVFKQVFGDDTEASASALAGSPDNVVLAGRNNIINAAAEETALCGSQVIIIKWKQIISKISCSGRGWMRKL